MRTKIRQRCGWCRESRRAICWSWRGRWRCSHLYLWRSITITHILIDEILVELGTFLFTSMSIGCSLVYSKSHHLQYRLVTIIIISIMTLSSLKLYWNLSLSLSSPSLFVSYAKQNFPTPSSKRQPVWFELHFSFLLNKPQTLDNRWSTWYLVKVPPLLI